MARAQKQLLKIHVSFTILTPDQLKEIAFGLNKDKADDGVTDTWTIKFSLKVRARKEDPLVELVKAEVEAVLKEEKALAEVTADKGLNKPQTEHLTLNVATDAERFKAGQIKEATLKRTVKRTLTARNA